MNDRKNKGKKKALLIVRLYISINGDLEYEGNVMK